MRRIFHLICFIMIGLLTNTIDAQGNNPPLTLESGESATGVISNINFEDTYLFEGEADELVSIRMIADNGFDTKLYLTTEDNELLAENDDFLGLNSLILYRLPRTDTYQIIATRLGDRFGSGTGGYTIIVEQVESVASGVTQEGSFAPEGEPTYYLFIPEENGAYVVTYRRIRGSYYPTIRVSRFNEEYSYTESIASLEGNSVESGSLILNLSANTVYVLGLENAYYSDGTTPTVFTLSVRLAE